MSEMVKKPLKITETILRDAHQSLIATRMTTEQMLPIIDKMDKIGLEGVDRELKEAGYGEETVDKYLYLFKGMESAENGFEWLTEEIKDFLRENKISLKDVEVMTVDGNGKVYLKRKNKKYSILHFYHKGGIQW